MLRTPWSQFVQTIVKRIGCGCGSREVVRKAKRRSALTLSVGVETLEIRQLLTPVAVNDSDTVAHDHTLNSDMFHNLLFNDSPPMGLTASLNSGVSHGSLTLHSDGSYSYSPSAGYVGSDSFTYLAYDGSSYSSAATVSLTVTNSAPTAVSESYTVYKDSMSFTGIDSVLHNDSDADMDTLTASLVTNVSHGSLTLNSDGTFMYTPTSGYFGTDSFVYVASDGAATSSNTTVTLTVTNPFGAQTNNVDTPFSDYTSSGPFNTSNLTGGVQVTHPMAEGHTLVYSSLDADVKPIIAVEALYQGGGFGGPGSIPAPDSVRMDVTFGGLTLSTIYYSTMTAIGGGAARFAAQIDASSLATGHYQYQVTLTSYYSGTTATRTYTGYQDIVNRQASEFGKGWNLAEKDGLAVQSGGVLWYGGAGGTAWFASNGSGGYTSPAGPLNSSTLVLNGGGTYTLTDKYGNQENFTSAGLLSSRVDRNGNTVSYAYSSGKLSTITDPYSRTTTFGYTSGLVSSITDIASNVTSLAYTSGKLTSITDPDPDGAGALAASVTAYAYTSNLLTTVTDALSHATGLSYSFGDRFSQATFVDSNTSGLAPAEMAGLVNTASGAGSSGTPVAIYQPGFPDPVTMTDSLSHTSTTKPNQFGSVLSYTDALSQTTANTYNTNGQITQTTGADPDGAGALTSPVTTYTYDSHGNLTQITYPDSSYETWTYHSTLNVPLTHTDQRGKTTTFTYDSHGNILTITDALSNVTTMTYNSDGTVATVTAADPDGAGPLASPVTSFTYDGDARATRITNPDTTHRDFTYDSANNVLTVTNELGDVTTNTYDKLSRLLTVTGADPDGGGPLASPVTTYVYDAMSELTTVTNPLGYSTGFAYNSRNWLATQTLPDPDGVGPLTAPSTSYGYNANGWRTTVTDPLGKVTTYAYNNVGWTTSITLPDPDGGGALTSPVTTYTYDHLGRVTTVTDPLSHATNYVYNSLNQVTSVTDALSKATAYTYDAMGNVLTVTTPDPDGAGALTASVTTNTYTDVGNLATQTSPLGYVTSYTYDHDNRLTTVTQPDPDGAGALTSPVTTYTYNSMSRVTAVTDPLGYVTAYAYDNAGEVTSVTAPDPDAGGPLSSPVTGYTYDHLGRIITVTDPNSHTTQYVYDANSQITKVTDGLGYFTTYVYDHTGRVTSRTDPDPDGAGALASPVTSYVYDVNSQITSVTDPLGNATTYAYDYDGRITTVTQPDPDGAGALTSPVTTYVYDAASNVTKVTDPLGNFTQYAYDNDNRLTTVTQPDPDGAGALASPVTTYTYDYMGRTTQVSDPLSHTTSYAYDANSNVTTVTDALSNVTTYARDHLGRVTSITDPDPDGAGSLTSPVTTYVYDANSRLTSATDPLSHATTYAYDNTGRLTSQTDAASHSISYVYDAAGNTTDVTDQLGYTTSYAYNADNLMTSLTQPDPDGAGALAAPMTTYAYDHLGRLTTTTDSLHGATAYAYDANGNLTSLTDSVSNTTTYAYDTLNRMTSETDQASHTKGYTYDASSRLISQTDKNSRLTNFTYDNIGRLTQEQWMSGGTPIYTATYAYDAASRLTSASDSASAYAYTYNSNDAVTQIDNNGTATGPRVVINVGYDNLSRMTSQSATVSSTADFLNNYTYDAASRLTKITQQGQVGGNTVHGGRVDFTYTTTNLLSTVDRYDDVAGTHLVATSTWGYDNKGQATSLSEVKGGTTLASYSWTYDHIGRLTADTIGAASDSYAYDGTSQLTAATHSGGGNESYSYDANGNRTNTGYTTTSDNKLTSDGTYNYTYDNEGNVTKKTTISSGAYVTYTWDYHNRLTDAKTYNVSNVLQSAVKYIYDVFDRLIEKKIDSTGGGTYTVAQDFGYDANNNIVLIYNGSGTLTDRLLNGEGLNEHLADENGSNSVNWYLTDREGTTNDVIHYTSGTNTTAVIDHLTYGAFGNVTAQTNSGNQPLFAYTGQMWDGTVGLYYYRARWYDARLGRFLNQDPLTFNGGDTNLYRYVANSPTIYVDPSGLSFVGPTGFDPQTPAGVPEGYIDTSIPEIKFVGLVQNLNNPAEWLPSTFDPGPLPLCPDPSLPAISPLTPGQQTMIYGQNAVLHAGLGDISGAKPNAGSIALSIPMSIAGIDIIKDITDLGHSIYNAKPTLESAGTITLNTVALAPGIGVLKPLIRGADVAAGTAKAGANAAEAAADAAKMVPPNPKGFELPIANQRPNCFPAGTLVATETGVTPIESLYVGQLVWSLKMSTEEWELRMVSQCWASEYEGLIVRLQIAGEVIESTENHPFWVVEGRNLDSRPKPRHTDPREMDCQMAGRWVDAVHLQECDILQLKSGMRVVLTAIDKRPTLEKVYNCTVERNHCYAVGNQAVLVHNTDTNYTLPDDAIVIRGGVCTPESIAKGTGMHPSGVIGFSVESTPGKSVAELANGAPHIANNKISTTTVATIRDKGGDVIPTSGRTANHATVTGLDPATASSVFDPPIPNPRLYPPTPPTPSVDPGGIK